MSKYSENSKQVLAEARSEKIKVESKIIVDIFMNDIIAIGQDFNQRIKDYVSDSPATC